MFAIWKHYFLQLRNTDTEFASLIDCSIKTANELGVAPNFPPVQQIRLRRKATQFNYEATDEPITDPRQKFKIEFHYYLLDIAINSLEERFDQLAELPNKGCTNRSFSYLKKIAELISTNFTFIFYIFSEIS